MSMLCWSGPADGWFRDAFCSPHVTTVTVSGLFSCGAAGHSVAVVTRYLRSGLLHPFRVSPSLSSDLLE